MEIRKIRNDLHEAGFECEKHCFVTYWFPEHISEDEKARWKRAAFNARKVSELTTRRNRRVFLAVCGNEKNILKCHKLLKRLSKYDEHYFEAVREMVSHKNFSSQCSIATPRLYLCAEKHICGIPTEFVMVMEYMGKFRPLLPHETAETAELLSLMYNSGCYHPDFKSGNFLINPENGQFALIDLDQCMMAEKCSADLLARHIGRYIYDRLHVHGKKTVTQFDSNAEELISCSYKTAKPDLPFNDFLSLIQKYTANPSLNVPETYKG